MPYSNMGAIWGAIAVGQRQQSSCHLGHHRDSDNPLRCSWVSLLSLDSDPTMTTLSPPQGSHRLLKNRAIQRFLESTSGLIGLGLTLFIVLAALLAPVLNPYDPASDRDYAARFQGSSLEHWFGADGLGRDILTLVWYWLRTSLVIGLAFGLAAGYFRGWIERVVGWMTDVMLAVPSILLAIAVVTVTGPSVVGVMFAVDTKAVQIILPGRLLCKV